MGSLALNMIVGPDEAPLLRRCLKSFRADEIFDEIVIVSTSFDERVEQEARRWTDKVLRFAWRSDRYPYGDFAGARNTALDNTESDYVMWLDADDVLLQRHRGEKIDNLRAAVTNPDNAAVDAYFMQYAVASDHKTMEPLVMFYRDRIFKRSSAFRWRHPVHELLREDWGGVKVGRINNIRVTHMPEKPTVASGGRNVPILRHEYDRGARDAHTLYFLARDSLLAGDKDLAAGLYKELIGGMNTSPVNLYAACQDLMFNAAYGEMVARSRLTDLNRDNIAPVEKWARLALSFCDKYAEPHVLLGDVYALQGKGEAAERQWLQAMRCELNTGMLQSISFYEGVPASRLADLYEINGQAEKALWYNKRAWQHAPGDRLLVDQRLRLVDAFDKEVAPLRPESQPLKIEISDGRAAEVGR